MFKIIHLVDEDIFQNVASTQKVFIATQERRIVNQIKSKKVATAGTTQITFLPCL